MSQTVNSFLAELLIADPETLALVGDDQDNIIVGVAYDRPPLLETVSAMIVIRPEGDDPQSLGSQLDLSLLTVYIEARSWEKQNVHDLVERIKTVLSDKHGLAGDDVTRIHRVRHDFTDPPGSNPDGRTYEAKVRFVVNYEG